MHTDHDKRNKKYYCITHGVAQEAGACHTREYIDRKKNLRIYVSSCCFYEARWFCCGNAFVLHIPKFNKAFSRYKPLKIGLVSCFFLLSSNHKSCYKMHYLIALKFDIPKGSVRAHLSTWNIINSCKVINNYLWKVTLICCHARRLNRSCWKSVLR